MCGVTNRSVVQRRRSVHNLASPFTPHAGKPTARATRRATFLTRAERGGGGGGFATGFVLGGLVFGALGFLFAPQISKRLLSDDDPPKLPQFLDDGEDESLEATRNNLNEKIAQLNAAIDDVSAQLVENTDDKKLQAD